jgi:hypothetical protein
MSSVTEELTAQAKETLQLTKKLAQLEKQVASQQEALEALPTQWYHTRAEGFTYVSFTHTLSK